MRIIIIRVGGSAESKSFRYSWLVSRYQFLHKVALVSLHKENDLPPFSTCIPFWAQAQGQQSMHFPKIRELYSYIMSIIMSYNFEWPLTYTVPEETLN